MRALKLFVACFLFGGVMLAQAPQKVDGVAAVVNQEVVTQAQVQEQIDAIVAEYKRTQQPLPAEADIRKRALDGLIEEKLQLQTADRMGIKVDDGTIDKAINDIASRNNISVDQLKEALTSDGVNFNEYRDEIRRQLTLQSLQQAVVASQIFISEKEIDHFIKSSQNPTKKQTQYLLQDYLVAIPEGADEAKIQTLREQAQTLQQRLTAGETISEKEATATDLGWRKPGALPSVFEKALQNMKVGEFKGPLQAANGFHILQLVDVKNGLKHEVSEAHLQQILMVPTRQLNDTKTKDYLNKVSTEIKSGVMFSKMAKKYSQDPRSAGKGGDMGWQKIDELSPAFQHAINTLKPGDLSEPFKTDDGWHLVKLLAVRTVDDTKAQERDQVRQWLFQRKFVEERADWLKQLREANYVKIHDAHSENTTQDATAEAPITD